MEGGAAAGRGRHRLTAYVPDVRVFICYASVDYALAESVDDILARSAVEVWRDRTRLEGDWSDVRYGPLAPDSARRQ